MTTYTANKTPVDLAGCGWYEILPAPSPAQKLTVNVTADWVIIGAGFAGLSAAARLAECCPGDKVVVLEAQRIAWGSAGRNSGFMVDLPHALRSDSYTGGLAEDIKQIRMNRAAIDFAAGITERFGLTEHFARVGKYHGAVEQRDVDHLDEFCRHLDKLNEPHTRLDGAHMKEITGSDFYVGGIHTPGCAVIQPSGYIRGLADGLRHLPQPVAIYENSPVMKIESGSGDRAHTIHTPHGKVSAARIILAMNGHAQSFGFHRRRLMHIFTYASMTRALSCAEQRKLGGHHEWGLIPADPLGTTVRRYRDRIVIRHTFTCNPSLKTSPTQVVRIARRHDKSFAKRFPMLGDVAMEYRWGGALCLSLNSVAAFGEVDERIYSAICQNGLGVVKGTYNGIAAVDLAIGNHNQIVTDMLEYEPPKKLFPEPFMSMAVNIALWWKQRKVAGGL